MSSRATSRLWISSAALAGAAFFAALPAAAQYQGQVSTNKNTPQLRAVGVLEWTGDEDHPKTSRLIPICVYDGQDLQDAGIYMSQPEPLALQSEVEYQLLQDGKPVGFFDIDRAAEQQGSWIGLGKWKALPHPRPAPVQVAKIDEDDAQSDVPILHRKHSSAGSGSGSGSNEPAPDPDRPTLHKGPDASSGNSTNDSGAGNSSGSDSSEPPRDPDRPVLRPSPDNASTGSASSSGSDRPRLKQKKGDDDEAYVQDVTTVTDPNRPHLFRGKTSGYGAPVLPTLVGLPPDMHQQVAVSDVTNRPVHVWNYSWANPDDEAKMKVDMENLARTALGLNPPPAPAKPAPKRTATAHKTAKPAPAPPLAPLIDEQFHVFELAYGSGATMVLSAHTGGVNGAPVKFVTLIGQPDLYGNVAVLLKNVTDAAHLDDTPRMHLVDAVDAMADNRGELVFELRGATQRQFALYRVLRGDASRIFLSSAESTGAPGE